MIILRLYIDFVRYYCIDFEIDLFFSFRVEIRGIDHHFHSLLLFRHTMGRLENHIFHVDEDRCYGCAACIALCPVNALFLDDRLAVVEESDCTHCNHCIPLCPVHALSIIQMVNS